MEKLLTGFFATLVPYWEKCEVHARLLFKGLYNLKELAVNIAAKM